MITLPLQGAGAVGAGAGARDAAQPQTPAAPVQPRPTAPQATAQPTPPAALSAAVTGQGGLAPLLSDLEAALASPDIPAAVRAAADRVLGFGLDADEPPTTADFQALLARSGLFLETDLAWGAPTPGDFKAMLLDLGETLKDWIGNGPSGKASLRDAPSPPFAGGPVRGQGVAPASLGPGAPSDVMAARLLAEIQAALARHALMQAASAAGPAKTDEDGGPATRWLFELPMAEADGRSVAQFEIARDGRRRANAETGATWRVRFSLDVDGLGPVHTALALTGERLHATLWAENAATEAVLSDRQDQLRTALHDGGLSAEVVVRPGAPPTSAPPAGRFMDTAA